MKELYTYKVNKEKLVENKVKNEDGSFTVTETVEQIPVEVFLKQPSRRDRDEMTTVYNQEFHRCISNGINSEKMLMRAILDANGGNYSGPERDRLFELEKLIHEKTLKYHLDKLEGKEVGALAEEIINLEQEKRRIEFSFESIFDKSAESIASKKYLTWAALHMTFLKHEKDFVPVFTAPTFISKLDQYYDMNEDPEKYAFELRCFDKAYVFLDRYLGGSVKTKEDFQELEAQVDKFLNNAESA